MPLQRLILEGLQCCHWDVFLLGYRSGSGPHELRIDVDISLCVRDEFHAFSKLISDNSCITHLSWDLSLDEQQFEQACRALSQNESLVGFRMMCRDVDALQVIEAFMKHPRLEHVDFVIDEDDIFAFDGDYDAAVIPMLRRLLISNRSVVSVKLNGSSTKLEPLEFRNRLHRVKQVKTQSVWPRMIPCLQPTLLYVFLKEELVQINALPMANSRKRTIDVI